MQQVVIFGLGPLANLLHHLIETTTDDYVVAFTVDAKYQTDALFCGKPVYAFEDIKEKLDSHGYKIFCAIGYSKMRARMEIFRRLKLAGWQFYSYISPTAVIDSSVTLGDNSVILDNVVIEPFCVVGDNNLIWSSVTLCHENVVGSHNFIAAGTVVGGCCRIGDLCFLGFNTVVIQNRIIADESLLGASSLILEDTVVAGKYIGSPAKIVGSHAETGILI